MELTAKGSIRALAEGIHVPIDNDLMPAEFVGELEYHLADYQTTLAFAYKLDSSNELELSVRRRGDEDRPFMKIIPMEAPNATSAEKGFILLFGLFVNEMEEILINALDSGKFYEVQNFKLHWDLNLRDEMIGFIHAAAQGDIIH